MEYFGIFEDTCLSQYFPLSHFPQQVAFNTQLFKTHSPPTFEHVKIISNIEKSKYLEYQKWVYISRTRASHSRRLPSTQNYCGANVIPWIFWQYQNILKHILSFEIALVIWCMYPMIASLLGIVDKLKCNIFPAQRGGGWNILLPSF